MKNKDFEKDIKRKELSNASKLARLKSYMFSKTKKIIERPRREVPPVIQEVEDDWSKYNKKSATEKTRTYKDALEFEYNKTIKKKKLRVIKVLILLFSIIFVLISLFYAGLSVFVKTQIVDPENIQIRFAAPKTVSSGEVYQMRVDIVNNNQKKLNSAELIINYPEGTKAPDYPETDLTIQRLQLGTISENSKRSGTLRAILFGKKGDVENIDIELRYRPEGSNYYSTVKTRHNVRITGDPVSITIDVDKEAIKKQNLLITVKIKSLSPVPMYNLILKAKYPFGFEPKKFSFVPIDGEKTWRFPSLSPGEEKEIILEGKIKGVELDEKTFEFVLGFEDDYTDNSDYKISKTLVVAKETVQIEKPFMDLQIVYNDNSNKDVDYFVANSGDKLNVDILWKNNTNYRLTNPIFVLSIDGIGIDKKSIRPVKGFYDSSSNVIVWNANTTKGALKVINAGESGKLRFSFAVPRKENLKGKKNPNIKLSLSVAAQRVSEAKVKETLEAVSNAEIRINSDIIVTPKVKYFTNPFGQVGPIPPVPNKQTNYAIQLKLENTTNDLENVKVEAELPIYVRWLEMKSPAKEVLTYSKIENKITWHIGEIKANSLGDKAREVVFNVALVPSVNQVGDVVELLQNIVATGHDKYTNQQIKSEAENITTELSDSSDETYYRVAPAN